MTDDTSKEKGLELGATVSSSGRWEEVGAVRGSVDVCLQQQRGVWVVLHTGQDGVHVVQGCV